MFFKLLLGFVVVALLLTMVTGNVAVPLVLGVVFVVGVGVLEYLGESDSGSTDNSALLLTMVTGNVAVPLVLGVVFVVGVGVLEYLGESDSGSTDNSKRSEDSEEAYSEIAAAK